MAKKTRFALIHLADFIVPKYEHFTLTEEEKKQNLQWPIPCYAVLIQHPEMGNILVDTGVNVNWELVWPQNMKDTYPGMKTWNLKDKLKEMGLYVDDIDMLILSHMHFDHSGNVRMFAGTKAGKNILVHEEDAKAAFLSTSMHDVNENTYRFDGYVRSEVNGIPGISYKLISEDTKLADDLELITLPGHTNGMLGVVLRTESNGTVIFPSDAIYNSINYGPPIMLPGMCSAPDAYADSINKCRRIAEAEGGKIFYSHDMASFEKYKLSPEWYE